MAEIAQMSETPKHSLLQSFKTFYQDANSAGIEPIDRLYTQDVEFRDPMHEVLGKLALKRYIRKLYAGLNHIQFDYTDEQRGEHSATIVWQAKFSHPSLSRGKLIELRGVTQIRFTDRIYYHENFYDLGAMLYQHIPVVGAIVRGINHRVLR